VRLAVLEGRTVIVEGQAFVDVARASRGEHGPDVMNLYERWPAFVAWAAGPIAAAAVREPLPATSFDAPSPRPRQAFGIGVNYADHASEAGLVAPSAPMVFAKFPSCIVGPSAPLQITVPTVDWEVELVVVMGRVAHQVEKAEAWSYVAGLTVGQDLSDRQLQMAGTPPQFNLGKSRPGYGPIGPWLVTPDDLADRDDLEIGCTLNGEVVQHSRTRHLIFDVAAIVSYLSSVLTLWPGDLIFTGTPSGVGFMRSPPRYLIPGDRLVSTIEGIGELVTHAVAGVPA